MKLDAEKMRWHRDSRGWTLETTAEKAEVALGTVLRAEHGEDIRPSSGRRIARAFGVDVSELVPDKPGAGLPKAPAPSTSGPPEEEYPDPRSPRVKMWLRQHGALFGPMSDKEFVEHVVAGELEDLEQERVRALSLGKKIHTEEIDILSILVRERPSAGGLFPEVPRKAEMWDRLMDVENRIEKFKEALRREVYSPQWDALRNYAHELETAIQEGKTRADLLGEKLVEARAA